MNWNKSVTRSELLCGMVVLLGLLFMIGHGMGAASAAELPSSLEGVPGTISYQGTLTTALGEPVNGTVAMTFRLYSVPTGGSALWTETRTGGNAVPVSSGLFHVQLGSLTPISESILRTETLYLGVQIASDSEMTPREVVGAVPMAMTVPDGSILTDKIEDGAVTSRQMDALEAYSYVGDWESTDSTTWTDLTTPQSINLQLEVPQTVYFFYKATVNADATTLPYIALFIDGELHDGSWLDCGLGVSYEMCSGFYRAQLSAGNHVISMKHKVSQNHSGTVSYWRRTLLAFSVTQ